MKHYSLLLLFIVTLLHVTCLQASSLETPPVDAEGKMEEKPTRSKEHEELWEAVKARDAQVQRIIKDNPELVGVFH